MTDTTNNTRRNAIKAGLATIAASTVIPGESKAAMPNEIPAKKAGETRVIFLGGDVLHNFDAQEPALRSICESAGWTFFALHDARYLTTDFLKTADLLMIQRWGGGVPGWVAGPIQIEKRTNDNFMSDELEAAIIDNVTNRGMGFMSLHCTVANWDRPNFMRFMGVNGIIHGPLQPVHLHNFNKTHPITAGMTDFDLALDENFGVEIADNATIPLYETTGFLDKRHDYGGWCLDRGKGRIVGLLAGHTYFAYRDPNYLPLYRRSAYWALKRDIPR